MIAVGSDFLEIDPQPGAAFYMGPWAMALHQSRGRAGIRLATTGAVPRMLAQPQLPLGGLSSPAQALGERADHVLLLAGRNAVEKG
jgi:hypothetical protein